MSKTQLLKWSLRLFIWLWVGYWLAQIFYGDLGASPALKLNHKLGEIVLFLLTANLIVGVFHWRYWFSERRFWGISTFLILMLHIFFYFTNEGFEGKAFTQVITKNYLIFGLLSSLVLFVLTLTSNNLSVRKLGGRNWKRLHRSVYAVQILLFGHILLIEKADLLKFGLWLGVLLLLQVIRLARWSRRPARQTLTPKPS